MHARIPQDVDLEDRLIYGLTPIRFGYLVIAVLAVLSIWRLDALPASLRAVPCLLVAGSGAALAWGRWAGRPFDGWLADLAVYVQRNYQLEVRLPWAPRRVPVPLRAISALTAPSRDGSG